MAVGMRFRDVRIGSESLIITITISISVIMSTIIITIIICILIVITRIYYYFDHFFDICNGLPSSRPMFGDVDEANCQRGAALTVLLHYTMLTEFRV